MDFEKPAARGRSYCSVYGCFNSSDIKPELSYFKQPEDLERRIKWLQLIGREELIDKPGKHYTVCEEHFNKPDILPGIKRKILKKNALPTLRLPSEPQLTSEETIVDIKIEESEDALESFDKPPPSPELTRKRKLASPSPGCSKKVLENENSNVVFLGKDTLQSLCNQFLTKDLADIVKAEINIKSLPGNKFLDYNLMNLHLFHSNPQAYRMLQNALQLPSITNLHKTFIPITTEINADFMSLLESKVKTMTDMEKNCSAVIGCIYLKPSLFYSITHDQIIGFHDINGIRLPEAAEKAYVLMVRGVYANWKQPVGYALLSRGEHSVEFNEWIDGLLEQLLNIGLNVTTFVSDTGDEFTTAAKNRSVTVEKPYFFINDKKIFYIFDAPHLIKIVRNLFMKYDFQFQDCLAKYEHVRNFYLKDKIKEFKLAPKLTKNHIHPTNFEKKKLHFATQLLSNSVATGISTYVEFHIIHESARDTADFIKLMNNLFDCLNSSDLKFTDEFKSVYRGMKSQTDFLNEMLIFFQNLKLCNTSFEGKFIEGFQITITSILQLFDKIKTEGYTFLPTRRLNMEVIDRLFDQVQTKCGIKSQPTSWQFVSTYRKYFLKTFMKPQERKNSADDLTKWVVQIQQQYNRAVSKHELQPFSQDDDFNTLKIKTIEYNEWEFNEKHHLFEVSHFLLVKCAEQHDCKMFKSYIKPYKNIPDFIEESRYHCYKEYSEDQRKSLIVVPCDNFVKYVKKIDAQFVPIFRMSCSNSNIGGQLYKNIIKIPYQNQSCACFPKAYLVKLFVRCMMYNVIKRNIIAYSSNRSNVGKITINRL